MQGLGINKRKAKGPSQNGGQAKVSKWEWKGVGRHISISCSVDCNSLCGTSTKLLFQGLSFRALAMDAMRRFFFLSSFCIIYVTPFELFLPNFCHNSPGLSFCSFTCALLSCLCEFTTRRLPARLRIRFGLNKSGGIKKSIWEISF